MSSEPSKAMIQALNRCAMAISFAEGLLLSAVTLNLLSAHCPPHNGIYFILYYFRTFEGVGGGGMMLFCVLLVDVAFTNEADVSADGEIHLLGVPDVFIAHYKPNADRKKALQAQLAEEGIDRKAQWIEDYDREDLDTAIIDEYYDQFRFVIEDVPTDVDPKPQIHLTHRMQRSHISLALKHMEAYRRIVQEQIPVALILEDDAEIKSGFKQHLQSYLKQLPPSWEMLCLGEGNPIARVPAERLRPGVNVYKSTWDGTGMVQQLPFVSFLDLVSLLQSQVHSRNIFRSSDGYVVTLASAAKLLKSIVPFAMPIDNQLR